MFYSQVILAKKGPLAKVWLAAHWGDKKLARPQIFATDISASVDTIVNPTMPLALRMSGHLLLGVVRIYSRKVKYVLSDCTEAMLKLQMAFSAKGKELLETNATTATTTTMMMGSHPTSSTAVGNFGEYEQVHVVEGFCLPLPDQSEWILCDDDDVALPVPVAPSPQTQYQPPQEETWVPFDPDHEDEEEPSQVSEVELARAAGDSFLSGDDTRRASSILGKSQDLMDTPMQEQLQQQQLQREEDEDFAHVPFDDDDDEQQDQQQSTPTPLPQDESLLHLSEDVSALDTTLGLDDSRDTQKRKSVDELPRKRRKRRKVVIDNDATELSNDHIKEMLADTSDLVKRQAHPADAPDDDMDEANDKEEFVPILTRPFLADTGHLHPTLAQLWTQNFYRALDLPCSFEKLETEEDVEHARQQQQQPMDEEDHSDMESVPTVLHEQQEQAEEEPDDFVPPPMDEEEEEDPMAPVFNDSEDEEQVLQHASIGDLGLVNELQLESDDDEEDEEQREVVGEHTGTKWHKHTVKVLKLLQSRLRAEDQDDDTKPMDLEFGELAKNVNRRTAASCFMECLQLKTWDFLELAQDEEYGPIIIAAGPRFQESPPNEA